MAVPAPLWARGAPPAGLLLDINGVLYDGGAGGGGGGGTAIAGSVDAVSRIKQSGLKLRFCTNETQATREGLALKLQRLGFAVDAGEIVAPAPAARQLLQQRGLRPHLLLHRDVLPEFDGLDVSDPNCVVLGDAAEFFTYDRLNEAFRVLIGLETPVLLSLGRGRYYKETDGLKLDVGAYMKALEYACDVEAEVVGKPSKAFFMAAVNDMGLTPSQVLMIGDDIVNDVGGAQLCGISALQVRTGKFMPSDEHHPSVKADGVVDDLANAVDLLLSEWKKQ
ncbi:phospholysine phosphohistidine inorganic pyrophosphate phosphatase [Lethenteron reissneri]|uniref:phospholysine phosphohistidine inorganic pyrophosphate phosphatase n=1 Tax=Lethenteron reissneri TaxID=7753 RepID=UPI002AB6D7D6|nr:phospholysine phosphohistidine inorganic pyrophosphate phosphatase [Lethenteron reissneri]